MQSLCKRSQWKALFLFMSNSSLQSPGQRLIVYSICFHINCHQLRDPQEKLGIDNVILGDNCMKMLTDLHSYYMKPSLVGRGYIVFACVSKLFFFPFCFAIEKILTAINYQETLVQIWLKLLHNVTLNKGPLWSHNEMNVPISSQSRHPQLPGGLLFSKADNLTTVSLRPLIVQIDCIISIILATVFVNVHFPLRKCSILSYSGSTGIIKLFPAQI